MKNIENPQNNKKKNTLLKVLIPIILLGGILAGILIPWSQGCFKKTNPSPNPPIIGGYNWDGTNWSGYQSGSLTLLDNGNHTASIQSNSSYTAINLTIPSLVVKDGSLYTITSIEDQAFYGNLNLEGDLVISNSITNIGSAAFFNCKNLDGNLTIGNNVASIGESAFSQCVAFSGNLVIPNSVISIGRYAFNGCEKFTGDLRISNNVTTIGGSAFYGCSGFDGNLIMGNGITSIGVLAFANCTKLISNTWNTDNKISSNSNIYYLRNGATYYCLGAYDYAHMPTGAITLQNGTKIISAGAFENCTGLTGNLTIPDSVISIGKEAFSSCYDLDGTLTIGSNVVYMSENHAFYGCSKFTSLIFNNFQNDPNWGASYIFEGWNNSGGSVNVIGNYTSSWTKQDALTYAQSKGLDQSWTTA